MADSVALALRMQILALAEAALVAAAPEAIFELEPATEPSVCPALGLQDGGHRVIERDFASTRYEMTLTVYGDVERDDGQAPVAERIDLHARTSRAMMLLDQMGGLIELIEDADLRMMTAIGADRRRLSFAQDFTIQFSASRTDPALPA